MKKLDFNQEWICKTLPDGKETKVNLPHDAMHSADRNETSLGEGNIGWFIGGDAQYRKTYVVPNEYKGKRLLIEFEGVYKDAEVYVNGKKVGERAYGYTNFDFDISDAVRFGEENEFLVTCKNSDQPNSRWYTGTGMYRPCYLYVGEKESICKDGIQVRTVSLDPAILEIDLSVYGEDGTATIAVYNDENREVIHANGQVRGGKASFRLAIGNAKLWSPESPVLYKIKASYKEDELWDTFGIRLLEWGPDEGLTINKQRVILRGACIHHDNGILGACAYQEAEERKVRILMENGYNAIRSAHNPCSKALLEACDRLGMLVMDEYVDVWYIHKTRYDYATQVEKNYKQDLAEMVKKDYNHPSVIMYSTGNEVSETAQKKGIDLTQAMTDYLHSLDKSRPVTCGINIFFNFLSSAGFGVYTDEKAEKQSEAAKDGNKAAKKKHVGSDFYNTLACTVGDGFMKWGASLPMSDWKTKDAYARMDIAGYNYGIRRYLKDLRKYPNRLILGSETFCKDAYDFWEIAKDHPRILGDFVWSGFDYIGETGEGAAEYSDYKMKEIYGPMTGGNGRIDLIGIPRTEANYTKVAFGLEEGPFFSVKPAYEKEKLRITGWQLSKGIESWSFRGAKNANTEVEIFARGASVEVQVNGKTYGKKTLKKCRATFQVPYEDGSITAITFDASGKELHRNTLRTAGERTTLDIHCEKRRLTAGELGYIHLKYTDTTGTWKPMEKHLLSIEVENGELVGFGSANPYVEGNYSDTISDTYFGQAMAVVRPLSRGQMRLLISDEKHTYSKIIPIS